MDEVNAENAFKKVFKYYKRKRPPPCLDSVLNPHNPDHSQHFTRVKNGVSNHDLYEVSCRPGLAILPGWLDKNEQSEWAERCLTSYSSSSNGSVRNIDALGLGQGDWWDRSVKEPDLLEKLRWATLGYHHNWDTKEYSEKSKTEFPAELATLASEVAEVLSWTNYNAEAAIVNYYPTSSTLNPHTDHSERNLSAPLVSISLGLSAVFLIGGTTLAEPPTPILLRSGDVLVMAGESRMAYHALPKVLPATWEGNSDGRVGEYLSNHRININVRQVNF